MKRVAKVIVLTIVCCLAGCDEEGSNQSITAGKGASLQAPEVVLVSMAGWTQTADTMDSIERAMIQRISGCLPNHRITVKRRLLGLLPEGDSELFLALEYEAWKQKKQTPAGRNNQFVAVGHSSGATAIYNLLKNGSFQNGPNAPAFLGLVDMALPLGEHDLVGKTTHNGARQTIIVHYHTGSTDPIAGITNMRVGADHFSIIHNYRVTQGLAAAATNACLQNSIQNLAAEELNELKRNNPPQTAAEDEWKATPDGSRTLSASDEYIPFMPSQVKAE